MPSRSIAVFIAAALTALLVLTVGSASAANTRSVYFGSPTDVCPADISGGCGGGIGANGNPTLGTLVFSPQRLSTSTALAHFTAYRLQVGNTSGSTLTHVVVLGGALAGNTTNAVNPPPSTPSLPAGLAYFAVLTATGPAPTCTVASDRFSCDFGNIAAGATPTVLTVVLEAPTSIPTDNLGLRPWNELQLKEGSSSKGANTDSFFAEGQDGGAHGLVLRRTSQDDVESFILVGGAQLSTDDAFLASGSNPTSTRIVVPGTADGDDARILETSIAPTPGCATNAPKLTCVLQQSSVSITTPINLVTGAGEPQTFTNANPLRLDFRWDAGALPGGATQNKLQIVEDNLAITTMCTSDPPPANQVLPCRLPTVKFSDKDLGITVYALHNGNWKPGY